MRRAQRRNNPAPRKANDGAPVAGHEATAKKADCDPAPETAFAILTPRHRTGRFRWTEVELDEVTPLFHEEQVGRELAALLPVRLQPDRKPDAHDGVLRQAADLAIGRALQGVAPTGCFSTVCGTPASTLASVICRAASAAAPPEATEPVGHETLPPFCPRSATRPRACRPPPFCSTHLRSPLRS